MTRINEIKYFLVNVFFVDKILLNVGLTLILGFPFQNIVFPQEKFGIVECLNYAKENAIGIKNEMLQGQATQIDVEYQKAQRLPDLNFSANVNGNWGKSIDPTTYKFVNDINLYQSLGLQSSIQIFDGNRTKNKIAKSQIEVLQSEQKLQNIKRNLVLSIVSKYLQALDATDKIANSNSQLQLLKTQKSDIQKSIELGSRAQTELYDIDASIVAEQQNLNLLDYSLKQYIYDLKMLINYDMSKNLDIDLKSVNADALLLINPDELPEWQTAYKDAQLTDPELKNAELEMQSSQLDQKLAKSGKMPIITANAGFNTDFFHKLNSSQSQVNYFTQIDDNKKLGIGLSIVLPIFDKKRTSTDIKKAQIAYQIKELEKENTHRQLQNNIIISVNNARSAKEYLQANQKTENLRNINYLNAKKKYDHGTINVFELLKIQSEWHISQNNLSTAKYDYLFKLKIVDYYRGKSINLE